MKFIFDNCISQNLARAIGILDQAEEIIHLQDRFPEDIKDKELLTDIGKHDFFLITKDKYIRKRAAEKEAFKKYKVGAFILTGKNLNRWQIIRFIINNWEKIKEAAGRIRRPFAFRIKRDGIERLPL